MLIRKKNRWFIIATAILGILLIARENYDPNPQPTDYSVIEELGYSSQDKALTLNLYIPNHPRDPLACIIVIQGGGFKSQNRKRFHRFAAHLANEGFAAALIDYRGRPHHTYRVTLSDVQSAVQFIRTHSNRFGIDPSRIGAMGRSAGATLALLLATVDEPGDGTSSRIQAAVGIAGAYNFISRFTDESQRSIQPELSTKLQTNGEWIGVPFAVRDPDWLNASPINHVNHDDPPVLLLHSRDDPLVPWMQSREMHDALSVAGVDATFILSETGGHSGPGNTLDLMVEFFRMRLLTPPASDRAAPGVHKQATPRLTATEIQDE